MKDGPCLDLARVLRNMRIPFVIFSGRIEEHERAPELGGAQWLQKPSPLSAVVDAACEAADLDCEEEARPRAETHARYNASQ